jgi:hypothetical protein
MSNYFQHGNLKGANTYRREHLETGETERTIIYNDLIVYIHSTRGNVCRARPCQREDMEKAGYKRKQDYDPIEMKRLLKLSGDEGKE